MAAPLRPLHAFLGLWLLLTAIPTGAADAGNEKAAWAALRAGAIVLFRHAHAPGVGDPANFSLGDCRTQRNLDASGQAQARRIGERLKREGVPVSALWSSQWCRTRDTAALFALGPVREVGAFNSFFGARGDEAAQTAAARKLLLGWRERGTLVVVTHQVNIRALTGRTVGSAEGVVLRRQGTQLQVVGLIQP
jgi:broad specificity phosphatase PhoE